MRNADYLRIYQSLREKIDGGDYAPGYELPTESALAEQFSCSRPTVRKAISLLAKDRLLLRRPGVGAVVTGSEGGSKSPLTIAMSMPEAAKSCPFYYDLLLASVGEELRKIDGILRLIHKEEYSQLSPAEINGFLCTHFDRADSYGDLAALAASGIPTLLVNRFPLEPELGYLAVDYRAESFKLVRRLLLNGAGRIGVLFSSISSQSPVLSRRFTGWKQAYEEKGIVPSDDLVFIRNPVSDEECFRKLFAALRGNRLDVLFVLHGSMMPVVIRALDRSGISVPVICFDDMENWLEYSSCPISYIRMPLQRMGQLAVNYFLEKRNDPLKPPLRLRLDAAFVVNGCDFLI